MGLDLSVEDSQMEDDVEDEEEPVEQATAAEIVQAGVARGQLDKEMAPIDQREVDDAEEQLIQQFARDGCKCDLGLNKSPCCTSITVEHFWSVHRQMLELTHDKLDLVVIGSSDGRLILWETSSHCGQQRGKLYTMFHYNGTRICKQTFLFLHTMGYWRFKAIKASYLVNGVVAKVHGKWKLGLSLKQIQDIVQFILNYAGV